MTLAELRAYLTEMTEAANRFDIEENAESLAARMWQQFTLEAIAHYGAPYVLRRIADCLSGPEDEAEAEEENEP